MLFHITFEVEAGHIDVAKAHIQRALYAAGFTLPTPIFTRILEAVEVPAPKEKGPER